MKRTTGLILCIFLLFIMTACSTKQPEDYITTSDTTLETEHFIFRFGSNVYIPGHTEQCAEALVPIMENLTGLRFDYFNPCIDEPQTAKILLTFSRDQLYVGQNWYTGLPTSEHGGAFGGIYGVEASPGDLLLGHSSTLIHELTHALMYRQTGWFHSQLLNEGFAVYTTYLVQQHLEANVQQTAYYFGNSSQNLIDMQLSENDYIELYKQPIEYWFENDYEYGSNANYPIGFRFMAYLDDVYSDYSSWITEFGNKYPYSERVITANVSPAEQQLAILKQVYGNDVFDNFYPWLKEHETDFVSDYYSITDLSNIQNVKLYPQYNAVSEAIFLRYIKYNNLNIDLVSTRKYLEEYKKADASALVLNTSEPVSVLLHYADGSTSSVVTEEPISLKNVTSIQLTGEGTLRKLEITGFPVTEQ